MSLKITIIENNQVKGDLDLSDTLFPFALTVDIADISNISTRGGSVTKTFKVPATKNNNELLEYYYNINTSSTLGFNLKCVISFNGVVLEEGKLRLKKAFNDANPKEYELIFYSNNNEWHELFQNFKISDLEFNNPSATDPKQGSDASGNWNVPASSAGVFTHDQGHMETSWFGTYTTWDYVYSLKSFGKPTGWRNNGAYVKPQDMRPDVYIRSIIRQAFDNIGWTIDSTFFDSADFKKLIMPCTGDFVHKNKIYTYSLITLPTSVSFLFPLGFGGFNFIQSNGVDAVEFITDDFINPSGGVQVNAQRIIVNADVSLEITADFTTSSGTGGVQARIADVVGNLKTTITFISGATVTLNVEKNDYIVFYIGSAAFPASATFTQYDISISVIKGEMPVSVGESFDIAYTLPEMTALEFIIGIFQLFNIYFWADSGLRKVYAEPRDAFFKDYTTDSLDWTDKIHVPSINIQSEYKYKQEFRFQYKEDSSDGYVKSVNEKQEKPLGSFWYKLNDLLNRGITKFENKLFAYTDNFNDVLIGTNIRIPRLWKSAESHPEQNFNYAPRILYYEGYVSQGNIWYWAGATNEVSLVPYSRTDKDTFNLSFDIIDGLVQTYYTKTLGTIDSNRLLACEAYLSPTDISNLDFRNPVYIDVLNIKGYYYLNKVVDYRPDDVLLTKIELVPIVIYALNSSNIIEGKEVRSEEHGVGIFTQSGKRAGTVLKNGTGNQALNGSIALGLNTIAEGVDQTVLGRYNVESTTDIYQVGIGTELERWRGITIANDGQFDVHGGEIRLLTGQDLIFAKVRDANGNATNVQKVYLKGDG